MEREDGVEYASNDRYLGEAMKRECVWRSTVDSGLRGPERSDRWRKVVLINPGEKCFVSGLGGGG